MNRHIVGNLSQQVPEAVSQDQDWLETIPVEMDEEVEEYAFDATRSQMGQEEANAALAATMR